MTNTITDVVSGIPEPMRKNFFKAFGQLCTAAVDIPVSWLESRASEIRAASEARIQIIKRGGEDIAGKLEIPEAYINSAAKKYAAKIVREQLNLDQIAINAANNLANESQKQEDKPDSEISEDWLNEFENYAKLKSSENMKIIFGKILSGEITKPGSFSIKTVRLISQLDNQAAQIFQIFCSNAISLEGGDKTIVDARVVSLNGNAGSNSLSKYGLPFSYLNILNEYGLIISEYDSYMPYGACIVNAKNSVRAILCHRNKRYAIKPTNIDKHDKKLKLHGVALTKAGIELLNIIPLKENDAYKVDFNEFLKKKHLKMVEFV